MPKQTPESELFTFLLARERKARVGEGKQKGEKEEGELSIEYLS